MGLWRRGKERRREGPREGFFPSIILPAPRRRKREREKKKGVRATANVSLARARLHQFLAGEGKKGEGGKGGRGGKIEIWWGNAESAGRLTTVPNTVGC